MFYNNSSVHCELSFFFFCGCRFKGLIAHAHKRCQAYEVCGSMMNHFGSFIFISSWWCKLPVHAIIEKLAHNKLPPLLVISYSDAVNLTCFQSAQCLGGNITTILAAHQTTIPLDSSPECCTHGYRSYMLSTDTDCIACT